MMRRFQQTVFFLAVACEVTRAALAQEGTAPGAPDSGPDLSSREARRQYVLKSAVAFADSLDRLTSERIAGGDLDQALRIKEHADLVRLGVHLPREISRVEGLTVDPDLERALSAFDQAHSLAVEACDAAKRVAIEQGEVFLVQELTAQGNELRADTARDFHVWDSDPANWTNVRAGRAAHQIPRVFPLEGSRIPDELNVRYGPQRFVISGRSRHDTIRYQGRLVGHIGKIGIIDRQLTEEEPVLRGVIRTAHPKIKESSHVVAFVQGNRIVDNAPFALVVDRIYDWQAELKDGQIRFTMTDGSTTLVDKSVDAATLMRVSFAVAVRRPPQEASIYVAWK